MSESNRRQTKRIDIDGWRVLIVDDHYDNLEVAKTVLNFHGAEVETARNGVEGMELMETFEPTVVLMDLSMPEMNGWEMFEALRANPKTAHIPVIAVTAHARTTDKAQVDAAGFTGYISKPFSVATFVDQIQEILNESNQAKGGK